MNTHQTSLGRLLAGAAPFCAKRNMAGIRPRGEVAGKMPALRCLHKTEMRPLLAGIASQAKRPAVIRSANGFLARSMIPLLATLLLVLAAPTAVRAATIQAGNVTTTLGPTFFMDDALNGGTDTDINQPGVGVFDRYFNGQLTRNQGPTHVTLTGFGFAAHTSAAANDAATVAATFTYLGANEVSGGGDDVLIGTATGTYNFTVGGEYVFAFDTPLTANLTVTGTRFRILVTPTNAGGNGSVKLKTSKIGYETINGAALSVAGFATPVINPERFNLAKFQTVTASSESTQRLASYVTDGVAGNDNRWQSLNWQYNSARVDFPFPVEVGSAHVFSGVDDTLPVGNFSIQYLDGSNWVTIPGASVSGNNNVERNLVFTNSVTATSFRLIGQDSPLRIRELALYPPNGPSGFPLGTDVTLNLAYQRPTVASASSAGNYALNAVDGRSDAFMWQTTTTGNSTLDIDLRVTSKIGSVHLYSGSTGVSPLASFVLKYWDGTAWLSIPDGTVTGNTVADLVVAFTTPVTTSKVRLEFTNPGTTSIRELCVFPANTGNVGYPIGTNIIKSGKIANYEDYNDAFYRVTNSSSSRFIAMASGGQPALDQTGITTAQGQYQILLNVSNGSYRLRNRATGNCLSGAQLSKTSGDALTDTPYAALPHQDWILNPLGGGAFQIINQWSGLAIDTQGGGTSQGTLLVQNTASSATTQRWQFSNRIGYPKKGIGGTTFANTFNPAWTYNWGRSYTESLPTGTVYHPMQWGDFSWLIGSGSGPLWQSYSNWRDASEGTHLLGFNEPDAFDQSGQSLDPTNPQTKADFSSQRSMAEAVLLWPRMQDLDQPLVSPAPAGLTNGWLAGFYAEVDSLGYRVDATAFHTYPSPGGGSSDGLFSSIADASTIGGKRPVWLTEFSFVDWNGGGGWTEEDNYNCLAEFLWRAESVPELRKYALFVFTEDASNPQPAQPWSTPTTAPRSNSFDISGNLTAFGKLYAAWDTDAAVRADKTYYVHNKNTRKRLANTLASGPYVRSIRINDTSASWTLVSTPTANRYYVVSSRDGRRLSSNGTTVTLATAGSTGTAVEWSLTESQYGWFYLGHPASSKRLKLAYNNTTFVATYTMAANTTTTDDVQWRFIVPPSEAVNTAPVLASITPQTVNEGVQLSFTANATDADLPANALAYSLVGAPSGAAINSTSGNFTWTPSESQGPGIFNFTVRVSDGNLNTDQAVSVTVNEVNTAPVLAAITSQTVTRGALLSFIASATDADLPANTLTYSLVGAPGGAAINAATGNFTWTPSAVQGPGSFNFTVRVSDGNLTHTQPVSVTVVSPYPSPLVDTDGDGLSDLLEYAFMTNPATANASPFRIASGNSNGTITIEFPWNWQATGLSWQIRHGRDLTAIPTWPVVSPGTTNIVREGNIDRISVTPAMAYPDRGFYILEVIP